MKIHEGRSCGRGPNIVLTSSLLLGLGGVGGGESPLPNPVQRLAVNGLKMDQPFTSVTKFVL